jgi:hypothetical protein
MLTGHISLPINHSLSFFLLLGIVWRSYTRTLIFIPGLASDWERDFWIKWPMYDGRMHLPVQFLFLTLNWMFYQCIATFFSEGHG